MELTNYKFSTVDLNIAKQYIRVEFDDDDVELQLFLNGCKSHIITKTGKTVDELDLQSESVICVLMLIHDNYEYKGTFIDSKLKPNPIYEKMIDGLINRGIA